MGRRSSIVGWCVLAVVTEIFGTRKDSARIMTETEVAIERLCTNCHKVTSHRRVLKWLNGEYETYLCTICGHATALSVQESREA